MKRCCVGGMIKSKHKYAVQLVCVGGLGRFSDGMSWSDGNLRAVECVTTM